MQSALLQAAPSRPTRASGSPEPLPPLIAFGGIGAASAGLWGLIWIAFTTLT